MAFTTIDNSELYFQTKLYTGNGGTQSITFDGSENMQPDWVWIKSRNNSGVNGDHFLQDSVRGATISFKSNSSNAEFTQSNMVTSFDSNGFSLGNEDEFNRSGTTFTSWNWKAGGSASSNSNGSITSSVSANTTAGFSIVSWTGNAVTGATIGHGLGVKPDWIILKNRSPDIANWQVYHSSLGATKYLQLNSNGTVTTSNTRWNNTEPTSTVFTTGSSGDVKGDSSGEPFIAYCFTSIKGYSKFGQYTGNGSNDGRYIHLGFRPAFVMLKRTDSTTNANWAISDNKRLNNSGNQDGGKGNYVPHTLAANLDNNEAHFGGGSGNKQDFLSNGFKLRQDSNYGNASSSTYVYMAFAESPFVNSNGIPTNAR